MEDPGVAEVEFRLTVVPARPAALILLAIALVTPLPYLVDPVGQSVANLAPVPLILRYVWETFIASSMLILVYHTLRQLRLFDRLHDRVTHVDLFDQAPIFGFSSVSSRTAIGLVLLLVPSVFLIPSGAGVGTIASTLIWYAVAVLFAAAAFVLPVRGVHGLLAAEKGRLQAEIGRRLTATLSEIHMAVDANDGEEVDKRNRAMSTLMAERELVSKVPTWPWSASALTGFVSAVLLPIGLWIVTRVLERIV